MQKVYSDYKDVWNVDIVVPNPRYREYVGALSEAYEETGFCDTCKFCGCEGTEIYDNKPFRVLGRVSEDDGADLETLPLWYIRFDDGFETAAYPSEICLAERD